MKKFERGGGLGISLEGTVDVEDGREVRPHHYIRSILPDGPVGKDGRLRSGDELLEVCKHNQQWPACPRVLDIHCSVYHWWKTLVNL